MVTSKSRKFAVAASGVALFAAANHSAKGAAFTAGDLVVYDATVSGSVGSSSTAVNILEFNPTQAAQAAPVQTLNTPLFIGASSTSNGYMRLTNNGSLVAFTGYTSAAAGSGVANTVINRGVGTYDSGGNYSLAATYNGSSGNQTRSATTADGTNYYFGDQNGIYRTNATSSAISTTTRNMQIFGATTYAGGSTAINIVTPASPASTGSVTLAAMTVSGTAVGSENDFIFVSSTGSTTTPDTLYVSTSSGIGKYAVSGTTLTSEGSLTVSGGVYGLTATAVGGAFQVAYTTGAGGSAANKVMSILDRGFGGTANFDSATLTNLYTAGANDVLKGIEYVPAAVAAPEPASLALFGLAAAPLLGHRRRRRA